jgi:serine/threonine protein kinase
MISIYEDLRNEFELSNGRYRCLGSKRGMLGEGSFALVLHGEDTLTQERVAIKIGRANNRGGGKEITEGEWRLMSDLQHENVVQALAFWKTPGQVLLASLLFCLFVFFVFFLLL